MVSRIRQCHRVLCGAKHGVPGRVRGRRQTLLIGAGRRRPMGINGAFQEFLPESAGKPDTDAKQRAAVRRLEYELITAPLQGSLVRAENEVNYDLCIHLDLRGIRNPEGFRLDVRPLNFSQSEAVQVGKENRLAFRNIRESEITRFIAFTISAGDEDLRQFAVRLELAGIPPRGWTRSFRASFPAGSNSSSIYNSFSRTNCPRATCLSRRQRRVPCWR